MAEVRSASSTTRGSELFSVWFRHDGMPEPGVNWAKNRTRQYTLEKIRREVGDNELTHLILSRKIVPRISTRFPQLSHLSMRDLFSEQIYGLRFKLLRQLHHLNVLDLSGNDFSSDGLPDIFSELTSLQTLNVSSLELSSLPASLANLRSLSCLDVSDNDFSSGLPDVIISMTSLEELNLSECHLQSLPASIARLGDLRLLNISMNQISTGLLPEDMFELMASLKVLNISDCRLTSLPGSVSKLKCLEELDMSRNLFKDGVDVIQLLTSLITLKMADCSLISLPPRFSDLQSLVDLEMPSNEFTELPSSVCELTSLKRLDISLNIVMTSLNPAILKLKNLMEFDTNRCVELASPPYEVCHQGLEAVRQYYKDMEKKGAGKNLPFVTIAVIGNTMSGKTSLIQTLQSDERKRVLTNRGPDAPVDETTKVFKVEEVTVDNTSLRLIDMGGQEIYHITYQLTLKQNCIPVIVISIEQYEKAVSESSHQEAVRSHQEAVRSYQEAVRSHREAVRRLAFDWMSHLYLANPDLCPPKLVFTHKDKLGDAEFKSLRVEFLKTTNELCREFVEEARELGGSFCEVKHFADTSKDVFLAENIFEVGKDDAYEVFDEIKRTLIQSAQDFIRPLPKVWEEVNEKVLSLQSVYNSFDDILDLLNEAGFKVERDQLRIILTYMHDCGRILWYPSVHGLANFIFHKVSEVTKLLCVLYHHNPELWKERLDKFKPYRRGKQVVEKDDCEALVESFTETGVLDEDVLLYLIKVETNFTTDGDLTVAVAILKSFRLLHGPLSWDSSEKRFIIPYFAAGYHDAHGNEKPELTLRVEIDFKGLSLPRYVFHQMSVGLLELYSYETASPLVKKNGASIYHDGFIYQLIHNYKSRNAFICVSSSAGNVCKLWDELIRITNNTMRHVLETWKASRPVLQLLCAHCLLVGASHPTRTSNPKWALRSLDVKPHPVKRRTESSVLCGKKQIPCAFRYPSEPLPEDGMERFKIAVKEFTVAIQEETNLQSPTSADDDLSDLSEDDDMLLPQHKVIRLHLKPTTNSKIQSLFSNNDEVYEMTPTRGRALLINNKNFIGRPEMYRHGSEVDVDNLEGMFKALKFKVKVHNDLTANEIQEKIKHEVELPDHKDYGCHFLVIMSHGMEDDLILGTDMKTVKLTHLYDLLTPINFPGMCGKPKVIIVETCSGDRGDYGNGGIHKASKLLTDSSEVKIETVPALPSQVGEGQDAAEDRMWLNCDDLLVIKASFSSFVSVRYKDHGCLMIRALVSTMYKHACHRDIYKIAKQAQCKVRKLSLKKSQNYGGQTMVVYETWTHGRRLLLFPRYNGQKK